MRRHLLAAAAALLLVSTGAQLDAQTLKIALAQDPDTLDPAKNWSFVGRVVLASVCDKLVDIAPDQTIVPLLATAWETTADGKGLTLKLRPGVTFSDGEPFNAAAVKFNIERELTLPGSRRKAEIAAVTGATVIDDLTVRVDMKEPFSPLIAQFTDRAGMMVSPKAAADPNAKLDNNPICVGAFRVTDRLAQDHITVERVPSYWDKDNIHYEKVVYQPVPDTAVRLANLRSGQFELIEQLLPTDVEEVKKDPKLKVAAEVSLGYQGITINIDNGPKGNPAFKKPEVREALSLAIDREALNQVAFAGQYLPGNQAQPPDNRFYNKSIPVPARDVAKATALLKQAGYEQVTLKLLVPNYTEALQVAQILQSMAAEAGINIELQSIEFISMLQQAKDGNSEADLVGWSGRVDPDGNISILLGCGNPGNDGHYCSKDLDAALARGRAESAFEKRLAAYNDAEAIIARDNPIIYLYHPQYMYGMTARLQGFVPYPDGIIRLRGTSLKE
ncbi:MAG TPA: ABC transporter substrate-binding protein [Stellaceae bacterium]|nr:ABC transporter substrate-binding protein [Stellaceae bacterium]